MCAPTSKEESKVPNMQQPQPPYSNFWNPHKTWLDLLMEVLLSFLLPFHKLVIQKIPTPNQNKALALECTEELSNKLTGLDKSALSPCLQKWKEVAGCNIVERVLKIPRNRTNILKEWGIYDKDIEGLEKCDEDLVVTFRIPASVYDLEKEAVTNEKKKPTTTTQEENNKESDNSSKGTNNTHNNDNEEELQQQPLDVSCLLDTTSVPVILTFHGGGFTIGCAHESGLIDWMSDLQKHSERPVIQATVEYRLAPRYPFPAAHVDALTAAAYLMEHVTNPLHVAGVSAGGNLATTVALECHRRQPGRIQTCFIMCPYLNPAADTLSYYQNQYNWGISAAWLRWSWQAYLGLEKADDDDDNDNLLTAGSNRTAWNKCHWSQHPTLARLANPILGVSELDDDDNLPKFVVTTNRADCCHDDGVALVKALKQASSPHDCCVHHEDHGGTHFVGSRLDRTGWKSMMEAWKKVVFPVSLEEKKTEDS